ncbi:MAG: hypothetical protein IKQ62_01720 [Bacteroidaceae bacterium]|nr:hypothetical protein [Bacteroidaceae bacterium]
MKYKYIINPDYEYLRKFIEKVPEAFDHEGVLVYDQRNQVRIFKEKGEKIVVKRFHRSLFPQRFDYTFVRPSKAKRAYTYGLQLLELGISTPTPIACIEEYSWGLFRRGFLISDFCGDPDARVLREEWETRDDLINALAHFLLEMHQKGFLHGDTNLSNFLYRTDPSSPTGFHITTIDINRSRFVENPTKEQCLHNLMRLTHVRPALQKIVMCYAELRGWNGQECYNHIVQELEAFESRREKKKKVKSAFK